jgi:WD40 repeat protein
LQASLPALASEIAKECGYLPLALAMAGAMVRNQPHLWESVLQRLQKANLEKIKRNSPEYPYETLKKAIQVSVDALSDIQEPYAITDYKERYLDFAIFAEDKPIPVTVLKTLWAAQGLDALDIDSPEGGIISTLVDRSLLQQDETDHLTLHDLQLDYVRGQVADLPARHNQLLAAYQVQCSGGWHAGPQDGYFFEHLAYHLMAANRSAELARLLLDFRWLQAKLEATDINRLQADYDRLKTIPPAYQEPIQLVRDTLQLAAHILAKDKTQLAGQLMGRLQSFSINEIQALLAQVSNVTRRPWLCPLTPSLRPPGNVLLRTLEGHEGSVNAIAITPDQQRIVSGSADGTLKLWDFRSTTPLLTWRGHQGAVLSVVVTPDGNQVVSGATDGTLKLWNLNSPQDPITLDGHQRAVNAIAVIPHSQKVISASDDRTLKVWDWQQQAEVLTLTGHTTAVNAVAVTPDALFALSADDETLKLWDLTSGLAISTMTGHEECITAVAITPAGNRAFSGARDAKLALWNIETDDEERFETLSKIRKQFGLPWGGRYIWDWLTTYKIKALTIPPAGDFLIAGFNDHTIKVWRLDNQNEKLRGELLKVLRGHSSQINAVATSAGGRYLVSGSMDATLKIWDLAVAEDEEEQTCGHTEEVTELTLLTDEKQVISYSFGHMILWDLETGNQKLSLYGGGDRYGGKSVAVTPDGTRALSVSDGYYQPTLHLWDLDQRQKLLEFADTQVGHHIDHLAITPDGTRAVSYYLSWPESLSVWNLESGTRLYALDFHEQLHEPFCDLKITPDGKQMISSSGVLFKVWDLETGEISTTYEHDRDLLEAITPDGKYAVDITTVESEKLYAAISIWDLATGSALPFVWQHDERISTVTVSADSQWVLSASVDGFFNLWSLQTGEKILTFQDPFVWVQSMAISTSGELLAYATGKNLKVWEVNRREMIACFSTDSIVTCCAITADQQTLVAGDEAGKVHILRLREGPADELI